MIIISPVTRFEDLYGNLFFVLPAPIDLDRLFLFRPI